MKRRPNETLEDFVLSVDRTKDIAVCHFARMWPNRYNDVVRYSLRQNIAAQKNLQRIRKETLGKI